MSALRTALSDRYSLDREIGRGGMAVVYLAHDLKHDRAVAIKLFKPELDLTRGADRFLREVKLTARLQHPHILPVYDSGEADQFLYYVMPFVEGESLRDRLARERRLPVSDALRIASEVAGALAYAHSKHTIHRDIKPGNILMSDGHAMVADFGIARALMAAAGDTITETGAALGTPAYMSPEQILGEKAIDGRSDIYSLGCVLFEMLTGRVPFSADDGQLVVARRFTSPPESIRTLLPGIPPELDATITRMLEPEPTGRFQLASDLARLLEQGGDERAMTGAAHRVGKKPARVVTPGSVARWIVQRQAFLAAAVLFVGVLSYGVWFVNQRGWAAQPPAAVQAFIARGDEAYNRSQSKSDIEKALGHYQKAVDLDSNYALGWAKLARTHAWMYRMHYDATEARLLLAKRAADRAMALDERLVEAHIATGLYYFWGYENYDQAVREFTRATELEPNNGEAFLQLGNVQRRQGAFSKAISNYRKSAQANPQSHRAWFNLGETLLFTRQFAEAKEPLERSSSLAPDFLESYVQRIRLVLNEGGSLERARAILQDATEHVPPNNWRLPLIEYARIVQHPNLDDLLVRLRPGTYGLNEALYHCAKGKILWQLGRTAAARAQFDSALVQLEQIRQDQPGEAWVFEMLSIAHGALGHAGDATRWAARAEELRSKDAFEGPGTLETSGLAFAMLGDTKKATDRFEHALAVPSWVTVDYLRADPLLAKLRDDEGFQRMLTRWAVR